MWSKWRRLLHERAHTHTCNNKHVLRQRTHLNPNLNAQTGENGATRPPALILTAYLTAYLTAHLATPCAASGARSHTHTVLCATCNTRKAQNVTLYKRKIIRGQKEHALLAPATIYIYTYILYVCTHTHAHTRTHTQYKRQHKRSSALLNRKMNDLTGGVGELRDELGKVSYRVLARVAEVDWVRVVPLHQCHQPCHKRPNSVTRDLIVSNET